MPLPGPYPYADPGDNAAAWDQAAHAAGADPATFTEQAERDHALTAHRDRVVADAPSMNTLIADSARQRAASLEREAEAG